MTPIVSVVITNYNYGRFLSQAIDSVLQQSYTHFELLVVDDGSTDDSLTIVKSYGQRIRWYRQNRCGVSAARNRGVAESTGALVAFLDADDLWNSTKLEKQVKRWVEDPHLGLIHCGVEAIGEAGESLAARSDGQEGWIAAEMVLLRRAAVLGAGSTALISREAFAEVGGYDTRLSTSADWDLVFRLSVKRRVGFIPDVLVRYRMHADNMHRNIALMEHDMLLAFEKAFEVPTEEIRVLKRQSYGNLHMMLAGSFFRAGKYYDSFRHLKRGLLMTPEGWRRVIGFPARWWGRRKSG